MSNDTNLRFILADSSSVGIVTRTWDGQQRNRVSIFWQRNWFFYAPYRPDRFYDQLSLIWVRGGLITHLYLVRRLRMVELYRHPVHTLSRSGALEWTHFRHTFISFTQRKILLRERINMCTIHLDIKRCIPCWNDTLNITSEWKSKHRFCRGTVLLLIL